MTRPVKSVHDMDIDEVSLVDRPANQHAAVLIAKNFQGDTVPGENEIEVFDATGAPVTEDTILEEGQQVFDAEGNAYTWSAEDTSEAEDFANAGELADLGKSAGAAFRPGAGREMLGKSLAETFREELSKAKSGNDVQAVIAKMAGALDQADQRAGAAEEIAKAERDLRLEREYIAKAAEYNLPIAPEELGPVLKRCAESLSFEDCSVINKVFDAAGEILFTELGFRGGGTPNGEDPMADAEGYAQEALAKSAEGSEAVSKAGAVVDYYASNPAAYDDYLRNRG